MGFQTKPGSLNQTRIKSWAHESSSPSLSLIKSNSMRTLSSYGQKPMTSNITLMSSTVTSLGVRDVRSMMRQGNDFRQLSNTKYWSKLKRGIYFKCDEKFTHDHHVKISS